MNLTSTRTFLQCLLALSLGALSGTNILAGELGGNPFHCPEEHVYIYCGELHSNLDYYGYPKPAYGYGKDIIIYGPYTEKYLDDCGRGKIIRKWKIKYHYDYYWCTQTIHIKDPYGETFDGYHDVYWPKDYHLKDCSGSIKPDHLPYGHGWPEFKHHGCSKLGLNYSDKTHPYSVYDHGDYGYGYGHNYHHPCKVIYRTWELIDWCQYTGHGYGGHYKGRWTYVQKIYVYDDVAPEITFCPDDIEVSGGDCDGNKVYVTIPKLQARDDCGQVFYSYTRKQLQDDHYGSSYSGGGVNYGGNDASGYYEPGKTLVTFKAFDICGNATECDFIVNVVAVDNTPPSVIGLSSLTVSLMMTDTNEGMVEIWPHEFNSSSYDNCTAPEDLVFKLEPSVFTCENFGSNEVKFIVEDEAGNSAYIMVEVIVQANSFACLGGVVSGQVMSDQGNAVKDVEVSANSRARQMTDENGSFAFDNIVLGSGLTITPSKNSDPMEGVDMYDYNLLSLHVDGIRSLKDPRKLIAADIDGNKQIDFYDLLAMEKMMLGIEMPDNVSWKFYKQGFVFPDTIDPLLVEIPASFEMEVYNGEDMSLQFEGIKIGDLGSPTRIIEASGDVTPENYLLVMDRIGEAGEEIRVPLVLEKDVNASFLTFALDLDPDKVEILRADGQQGIVKLLNPDGEGGSVVISWYDLEERSFKAGDAMMELVIKAKQPLTLSKSMRLSTSGLEAKAEGLSESQNLKLVYRHETDQSGLMLYQNSPNPFEDYTTIGFYLPAAGEASISVRDASGRELFTQKGTYVKGYQEVTLRRDQLPVNGLVFYQIESQGQRLTRKMILLD